jgi:hypothetical protein
MEIPEIDGYEDFLDCCASERNADFQMELDAQQPHAPAVRKPPLEDLYTAPHRPVLRLIVSQHLLIRRPRTRGAGRPARRRVARCSSRAGPDGEEPAPGEPGTGEQHLAELQAA